jgi:CRP-like cAMP-binding protein
MNELLEFLQQKTEIQSSDLENICFNFKELRLNKNDHFLRQGQRSNHYVFIKSGGLRIYLENEDKQVTVWLAFESCFFAELSSLKNNTPSRFNIQAFENCQLYIIPFEKMEQLYIQYPGWQKFVREIWEEAYVNVMEGIIAHQLLTAEERYLLCLQQPEIMQRVPLKYVASFLGITTSSLSRLRNNIR